jgi:hypothetical protein
VNNITDYLKFETNQLVLELEEFKLKDLIKDTLEMIRPKRKAKGIGDTFGWNPF